jgi:hypothetical protein
VTAEGNVVIVEAGDFVRCGYAACGALRPLAEVLEKRACLGCGRL